MKPPVPVKTQEKQKQQPVQPPQESLQEIGKRINQGHVDWLNRLAKEQPNYQVPY